MIVGIAATLVLPFFTSSVVPALLGGSTLLLLAFTYSNKPFQFSYNPVIKLLSMSLTYAYIPLLIGVGNNFSSTTNVFGFLVAGLYTVYLPYSDIKDIKGDLKYGKRTIANTLGLHKTLILCTSLSLMVSIALMVYMSKMVTWPYLAMLLLCLLALIQIVACVYPRLVLYKKVQIFSGTIMLLFLISVLF